ncbi:uncharacterized protein LOC125665911 [Ostrea edulis]|uniref:uncharacterized protein LOC125665911 n=1 Tax=Ostrea edulis TaxID=37623 RepID=UPI0024AFEAD7|nr:uncharacterized protein LOC125665911 [Ostrea edulis]
MDVETERERKDEQMERTAMFTTLQEHELKVKELRSVFVEPPKTMDPQSRTTKEKIQSGLQGVKNGSKRFANFVRSKIIRRKEKETVVQDINIVQEDNETWARRSVGSAASRTSIDSKLSSGSDKTKDVNILTNLDDGELEE